MNESQIVIVMFGLLYLSFVLFTRRKGNFEEFSVAGRGVGLFLIFASISATYLGPAWTLGLAREGYAGGLVLMIIGPIAGIGLTITAILFAGKVRTNFNDGYSLGDVVGGPHSHNHQSVKLAAGIVTVLYSSTLVIAMSYAGGELINHIFGYSRIWSIVIITVCVTVYSLFGGIRATIQTDAIQFLHFVILIPLLAILMISSDDFSWQEYKEFAGSMTDMRYDGLTASAIFGIFFIYLFGAHGLDAGAISRYLASKDKRTAQFATLMSGIFIGGWIALMVFIGNVGAYLYPELTVNDQLLLHISEMHYSGIMYGIFIIALVGVVMSSQDTLLNIAGVSFSEDVVASINPAISDKTKLWLSKAFTVGLGLLSISVASFLTSVLDYIMMIIGFYLPLMVPVTLFAVFKKQHNWQSAIAAIIVGPVAHVVWAQFGSDSVPSALVGMLGGALGYLFSDLVIKGDRID